MKHIKVGSVLSTEVVTVRLATPFREVARLLAQHRISGLPVIDADDNVIGVISETDLLARESEAAPTAAQGRPFRYIRLGPPARGQHAKIRARTAGRLMSKPPVCTHAEDTIAEVARTMAHHKANASRGARSTTKSTAAGSRSSGTRSLRERPGDL